MTTMQTGDGRPEFMPPPDVWAAWLCGEISDDQYDAMTGAKR